MDTICTHQFATLQSSQHILSIVFLLALLVRLLDATPCGSVVVGNGEANHRTVGQVDGTLYQALAKGATTYDNTAVVVLDGTRDNLCCRSGIAIDQYDDLSFSEQATATSRIFVTIYATTLGIDDETATLQQFVGHLYSCLQIAATILLKVSSDSRGTH